MATNPSTLLFLRETKRTCLVPVTSHKSYTMPLKIFQLAFTEGMNILHPKLVLEISDYEHRKKKYCSKKYVHSSPALPCEADSAGAQCP